MNALRIALLGAAASLALGGQALAQDDPVEVSFNIGAATEYVFRGISQTDEEPQVFGGVDIGNSQFYAGVWASNVDFLDGTDAEVDLYAGFTPTLGAVDLDLGVIYYGYVGAPSGANYDFWELKAAASMGLGQAVVGAGVYYSPDFFGGIGDATYAEINAEMPINPQFSVSGAIGRQWLSGPGDYTTWNLGVGFQATENIGFDLRYWDTDDDLLGSISEERIVLSVKGTF